MKIYYDPISFCKVIPKEHQFFSYHEITASSENYKNGYILMTSVQINGINIVTGNHKLYFLKK